MAIPSPGSLEKPSRGQLHLLTRYGLGNRLCALLSAAVVAEELGAELHVTWAPSDIACGARLGELFELSSLHSITLIEQIDPGVKCQEAKLLGGADFKQALGSGGTLRVVAHELFGQDLFPSGTFSQKLREKLRELRPVPEVQRLIDSVPAAKIGLHARMTDHLPSRMITPRWCYRQAMRTAAKLGEGRKVYVCSDTPAFVDELVAAHPSVALSLPRHETAFRESRSTVESVRIALAELWILSSCDVILASPFSSFARIAIILGGGNYCNILAWTHRLLVRQKQFAWFLSNCTFYIGRDRWTAGAGSKASRFRGKLVSALANRICSHLYQDHAFILQRLRLSRRVASSLKSNPLRTGDPLPADKY